MKLKFFIYVLEPLTIKVYNKSRQAGSFRREQNPENIWKEAADRSLQSHGSQECPLCLCFCL